MPPEVTATHPFTYSFTTCFKEEVILDRLGGAPQGKVLEMGCGSAYFANVLRRKFPMAPFTYVGIDLEPDAVNTAKAFITNKDSIVHGSVEAMPFEDQHFDSVLYLDVIEHVQNDKASLQEAFRVLKPGGRITVSTPNAGAPLTDTFFCEYMHDHGHMENQRHGYHADELTKLMKDSGFEIQHVDYSNVFLSELLITATKLGYRLQKPKYNSQADVVAVSDSLLFKLHKNVFFPLGYAIGKVEEAILGKVVKGHCLIITAKKPG